MKHFKNKKIFTYMVVGALVMALSISCKSNEDPSSNWITHSNHPTAGTYKGDRASVVATVTISGGACNIKGTALSDSNQPLQYDITITKWLKHKDADRSRYILGDPQAGGQGEATINSPSNPTSFRVDYYDDGRIYVDFVVDNIGYYTYYMTRQ